MIKKNRKTHVRRIFSKLGYVIAFALVFFGGLLALIYRDINGDIGIALITFCLALILIESTKKNY